MTRRIHGEAHQLLLEVPGQRIEQGQVLDLVVEHLHPHRELGVLGRETHRPRRRAPEGAAAKIQVGAGVLHRHQALDQLAMGHFLALAQMQHHAVIVGRIADAVDARHARHDHHIAPLHQALGRRQAHLLDVLVDRESFSMKRSREGT